MEATARIERMRNAILGQPPIPRQRAELLWSRAWMATAQEPWHLLRRARCTAAILEGLSPEIGPDDLLAGRYPAAPLSAKEGAELARLRDGALCAASPAYGQRSHMAIDYDTLLRRGLDGLRAQIGAYRARLDLARPDDLERDAFYRACVIALDGLSALSRVYASEAERLAAGCQEPWRRSELEQMAAALRHVPDRPARTFREALQSVHLVTFALCAGQRMQLLQLGRPDRYLLPYYRRDLANAALTLEDAQEWIDALCLMLSTYTDPGLAVGFMIGGRDAAGGEVSNALTELFLESISHTRLPYPGIGLCWSPVTPAALTRRACELLVEGHTHPALFNDEVITDGMLAAGLPPAEACLYQHSTCVEITPIASSNVYVASPYINLLQLLHDTLGIAPLEGGRSVRVATPTGGGVLPTPCDGRPAYVTFDDLLSAYDQRLAEAIRCAVVDQNTCQASRFYHGGYPLLSCFVNDCLARGRDIDQGGARHNWVEPSFVGLANLVDALAAIRQEVYEDRRLTLDELSEALAAGYEGKEALRLRMLHEAPKYGNDDETVDDLARRITERIVALCRPYRTYLGGAFHPGFFCWIQHERLGAQTAASADGRPAGQALGDGSGPAQGRERRGPTAAVLSTTCWDHRPMLGGIAMNVKFARPRQCDEFVQGLQALVETYMARGGFELQVNVVDAETLRDARSHPEQYRDLVVRIGGYSDYFVRLSDRMQEELILRTEHGRER